MIDTNKDIEIFRQLAEKAQATVQALACSEEFTWAMVPIGWGLDLHSFFIGTMA